MRRLSKLLAVAAALAAPAGAAEAQVSRLYTDALAKCIVEAASPVDQTELVIWIFSAMSRHPAVASYANVSDSQLDEVSAKAAQLMERLLTADCRKETLSAIRYEGPQSIEQAFGVLGQVAMRGLMTAPQVTEGMEVLARHTDKSKLEALGKEAAGQGATPAR